MGATAWVFSTVVSLLLAALWLYREGDSQRQSLGVPQGRAIYRDSPQHAVDVLVSDRVGLSGKPDYLFQEGEDIIPVEVKSSAAPHGGPYNEHIFQLAAYCLLVEENYGIRPKHGIIRYKDETFQVEYTHDLELELLDIIELMREGLYSGNVDRSHNRPGRCNSCGVNDICDQRLY